MAEEKQTSTSNPGHASSTTFPAKAHLYQAAYLGSGTFIIVKPKRKSSKRRQSALKGTTRGSRK